MLVVVGLTCSVLGVERLLLLSSLVASAAKLFVVVALVCDHMR